MYKMQHRTGDKKLLFFVYRRSLRRVASISRHNHLRPAWSVNEGLGYEISKKQAGPREFDHHRKMSAFSFCLSSGSLQWRRATIFSGDAHSTDATPQNIFNKKLTMTTVTR